MVHKLTMWDKYQPDTFHMVTTSFLWSTGFAKFMSRLMFRQFDQFRRRRGQWRGGGKGGRGGGCRGRGGGCGGGGKGGEEGCMWRRQI